jgi:NarL family two-component system response regulator LiaR
VIKSILLNKKILVFAGSFAAILIILKTIEFFFFHYKFTFETYLGIIATIFLTLGIYFGSKLGYKKVQSSSPQNSTTLNEGIETDLSLRELEVLLNISDGLTNQQIADKLFISLNTIKTHTANIYSKLGVKSRTQAISKAKSLNLIN